jgi:hypothetical protein
MKHKCLKYVLRFTLIGKLEKILKDASRIFKRYQLPFDTKYQKEAGTFCIAILSIKRKLVPSV